MEQDSALNENNMDVTLNWKSDCRCTKACYRGFEAKVYDVTAEFGCYAWEVILGLLSAKGSASTEDGAKEAACSCIEHGYRALERNAWTHIH